jgi:hypothetical protein
VLLPLLDALAFSSVWVAAAAALLCAAAAHAMGISCPPEAVTLAFGGTLAVYNIDRLRDLERDRVTAPLRSAFVEAHRSLLMSLALGGGALAAAAAVIAGARSAGLAAVVLGVGLAHRRLKRVPFGKAFYIAAAWCAVVVGLPILLDHGATHALRVALLLYLTLLANAVASSARDAEAGPARIGLSRSMRFACVCAIAALVLAATAAPPVTSLAWVAGLTTAALIGFRPGERFGLLVLDGGLLAGAALGLLLA